MKPAKSLYSWYLRVQKHSIVSILSFVPANINSCENDPTPARCSTHFTDYRLTLRAGSLLQENVSGSDTQMNPFGLFWH